MKDDKFVEDNKEDLEKDPEEEGDDRARKEWEEEEKEKEDKDKAKAKKDEGGNKGAAEDSLANKLLELIF
jgi:hypothetical protein